MVFSARRIKEPKAGVLSMHPFVDVLEGRAFLCGSVHDGMLTTDDPAGADAAAMSADGADAAAATEPANTVDYDDGHPSGAHRAVREGLLGLQAPARVELTTADGEMAFSVTPIDDGDDIVFGNLLHDRRGREAAKAAAAPVAGADVDEGPFRTGRALTGAMRPYLTAVVPDIGAAFAA